MKKLLVVILSLMLFVPASLAADTTFEDLVLDVIRKNPEVVKQALQDFEKKAADKEQESEFQRLLTDKADLKVGKSPLKGKKNAKYTIFIFSDFQCPFCKRGDDTIKALEKKYGDDIAIVFKHFPLDFHPQARPASKAVWAAGKQNKFYEYHDKLWENQANLTEETFAKVAKELNLDIDKFNKDRNSEEAEKAINDDMEEGKQVGIRGTPGFVLNGVKIFGAYPIDHFEKVMKHLDTKASN